MSASKPSCPGRLGDRWASPQFTLCYFLALFLLLVGLHSSTAFANDAPIITAHSKLVNTIFQGDSIELEARAEGQSISFRWFRHDEILCETEKCSLDASQWSLGRHKITLVVYNQFGSNSVNFMIRVLARPLEERVTSHTPKLVRVSKSETILNEDLVVKSFLGVGYCYHKSKVDVVGKLPRLLDWNEKLRSHVEGVLTFGRKRGEEHFVLPASVLLLKKDETIKREIKLLEGIVRSRSLNAEIPQWEMSFEDFLKIYPSVDADIILSTTKISKTKSRVEIIVLRGSATAVFLPGPKTESDQKTEPREVLLLPGTAVEISEQGEISDLRVASSRLVTSVLKLSSPQYISTFEVDEEYDSEIQLGQLLTMPQSSDNLSYEEALKKAGLALEEADFIMAIETLLPQRKNGDSDFSYHLMLGRAYRGIFLYKEAQKCFSRARKLKEENPEPYFEIALMNLAEKRWKQALKWLDAAEDYDYPDRQQIDYYRGVAHFNLGELHAAKNYFQSSFWWGRDEDLELSATSFIRRIKELRPLGVSASLAYVLDSNVYGLPQNTERPPEYRPVAGKVYLAKAKVHYTGFSADEGSLVLAADIEKRGFLSSKHRDLESIDQRIYVDWIFRSVNGEEKKADFEILARPYMLNVFIGPNHSDIALGALGKISFPSTGFAPSVSVEHGSHLDPYPNREDTLDPVTREVIVGVSDRSAAVTSFSVGAKFLESETSSLGSGLLYITNRHKRDNAKPDDFAGFGLKLNGDHSFWPYFSLYGEINYLSRNYPNSEDNRKDSETELSVGSKYYWNPSLLYFIDFTYQDQQSNVEFRKHKRNLASFGLALEL